MPCVLDFPPPPSYDHILIHTSTTNLFALIVFYIVSDGGTTLRSESMQLIIGGAAAPGKIDLFVYSKNLSHKKLLIHANKNEI